MRCTQCNSKNMKNCFQAGQSEPICQKCFFGENNFIHFHIFYETRNVLMNEIDKIHSDMIGLVGGNSLDITVEDIAFNDDNTAMVIGKVKGNNLSEKSLEFLQEKSCETFEEADKNLHKFVISFVNFSVV